MNTKPLRLLLAGTLFLTISARCMNVRMALNQKLIEADIKWHTSTAEETTSLRHGNNIVVCLLNKSNKSLSIEIPEGFMFTAADSTKQNILITELMQFELLPQQRQSKAAYGYCCEAHDGGPVENEVYKIKKEASENLMKLARFASKSKMKGYAVQRAIWCVSDKNELTSINSEDSAVAHQLISFTGNLLSYSPQEIDKAYWKSLNGGKEFEKLIRLEIPISSEQTQLWIVIQNVNNNTIQTVMTKQRVGKGIFKKQFGVSSIDLGKGEFTVRVYSTDRPVMETKFKLDV